MWINHLINSSEYNNKILPIYYNAWVNDDYSDAFTPLLSKIDSTLFTDEDSNELLDKFKSASITVLKTGITNLVSNLTKGFVDFQQIIDEWNKKDLYKETIEEFNNISSARKTFLSTLEEIVKSKNKKVFIFIDELDRCRPTFAIETLERIKHYFDVENIYFIFLLDRQQLSHSVKVLYGSDCDTSGYLLRFFDIEYTLPETDLRVYIDAKFNEQEDNVAYFLSIAKFFNLSLRDYEKLKLWIDTYNNIFKSSSRRLSVEYRYLVSYFLLIKLKYPDLYDDFFNKTIYIPFENMPYSSKINGYMKENANGHKLISVFYNLRESYRRDNNILEAADKGLENTYRKQNTFNTIRNMLSFAVKFERLI
jgi:hypothetical protein